MKASKFLLTCLLLLMAGAGSAWAHGARVGVYVGPYWGPFWYPPPYYYEPRVIVVPPPAPPPVYIEQQSAPEPAYWYYCASAKGYYPYVKACPEGWQRVLPQPEK